MILILSLEITELDEPVNNQKWTEQKSRYILIQIYTCYPT